MLERRSLLVDLGDQDVDPQAKLRADVPVLQDEEKRYRVLKWVAMILLVITGIAQLVLLFATHHTFTLELNTTTAFRHGPRDGPYPAPQLEQLGTVDAGAVFAVASILSAIGYLLLLFVNSYEVEQIARGSDGYMWGSFMLSQIPVWLGVVFVAGANEVWSLVLASTLVFAWLGIFLLGDIVNQNYYRDAMRRYGGYTWSWAFLVLAVLTFIVFAVFLFWHTAVTFSGEGAAHLALLSIPITAAIIYLVFVVFILLHYVEVGVVRKPIDSVFSLQLINLIFVFVVTWLAFILFAFEDGKIPVLEEPTP